MSKSWTVHYECFSGDPPGYKGESWGRTGDKNIIGGFTKYDPKNFQGYAPGGWEITRIERVGNHQEEEDE